MLEWLLIWVQNVHLKLAVSRFGDDDSLGLRRMKEKSRELIVFAGMLKEDVLPSQVYARLCALDSEIGAL